jgi:hypothetical protein
MTDFGCPESVHLENYPPASACDWCSKPGCDFFKHFLGMTKEKAVTLFWVRHPGSTGSAHLWDAYDSLAKAIVSAEGAAQYSEYDREVFTMDAERNETILAKVEFVRATTRTVIQDVS